MPARPIRLMTTTVASALAVAISASAALACYSCGGCAPASMALPRVYAPPYVVPTVVFGQPCNFADVVVQPAYRVDLGPTYLRPVATVAEPVGDYVYPRYYPRHYPYVSRASRRWASALRRVRGSHRSDEPRF